MRCSSPLAACLFFLALVPLRGQQPPPESYAFRVDVRLVNVEVSVTDAEGNFVANLTGENFRVWEDGEPQTVAHFTPTRAPTRIVLLVEANPAVFLIRRDHLTAAYHLLRGLRAEDQVALVSYARTTHREVDFTADKALVEQRLGALGRFGLGIAEMNLLDAVAGTLDWLSPPPRRTAVLMIGTGLDTGSSVAWNQLRHRMASSQVTFFTLATGGLLRPQPGEEKAGSERQHPTDSDLAFAEADARLRALAEAGAGRAYFPKSAAELDTIYRQIAERLGNLYSLGYYPTNTVRDGAYRSIRVELTEESGTPLASPGHPLPYRVYARPGYFAPSE